MVSYDDRSYFLDGRRVWLASGSIHYFRLPHQLWRDRLLKAKRSGLNCIETYVAWNFHEAHEGKWDFNGDKDLREFIIQAGELGLYVILRPGPYICAEWDFGGLPSWLMTKSGITYRTANAAYMHYLDKYMSKVLPLLVDLQVTRGGNIILIQNENEYYTTTLPDRLNYCQFITQLFRKAGFDIPVITCNNLTEPRIPETIECCNAYDGAVQFLKHLRTAQPDAPMLATEFWPGWFDYWGGQHSVRDAREVARKALEILGCGCQVNYYVWHGGTNFAFRGGQLVAGESAWQTTSYDYDAPLAEGGGLTEKYYLTKLVNMLADYFGQVLAQMRMEGPGVTVHNSTQVLNLSGPSGRLAVITNNGRDEITTATVSLPDGKDMEISLLPLGAVAVPIMVKLTPDHLLNYANLMPLGLFGEDNLVLHGPAGWEGRICINDREIRHKVPDDDKPLMLEHSGQKIIIINSDLAQRTWEVNGSLVLGPKFVGETIEDIMPADGMKQYSIISPDGQITNRKVKSVSARRPAPPRLGAFERMCVCEEPISDKLEWDKLDRPRDLATLGIDQGYGWYRLVVDSPRAARKHLFLPDCEDRALIYVNGDMVGVWGRGPDAVRKPIPVSFRKGQNVIVFLADNLGRVCVGHALGRPKGIFGHVWEAESLRIGKFKVREGGDFSRRMVPRIMSHLLGELETMPMSTAEVTFNLPKIHPIHLSFSDLNCHLIVICNDRQAKFFPDSGGYGDVTLGKELKKGKNTLRLLLWGNVDPKDLEKIKLHLLTESISAGGRRWAGRKWSVPSGTGRVVGKGLPAWYRCRFKYNESAEPLFLRISGAKKGQIYLNGHNVGRFWNIGPQEYYYLPEPWLADENELLIFEEQGHIPSGSRLVFRPAGPYRD